MDKNRDISLENILLEHELRRKEQDASAPSTPAPVKTPQPSPKAPRSAVEIFGTQKPKAEPKDTLVSPKMPHGMKFTPPQFPRDEEAPPIKTSTPKVVPMQAPEDDVRIASTRASDVKAAVQKKKEEDTRRIPSVRPAPKEELSRTVEVSMRTRLLSVPQEEDEMSFEAVETDGQLEGQLVMEHFVDDPYDEERLEEELLRRRREKAKGFRIIEGGKPATPPPAQEEEEAPQKGFKLVGEEEESDPEETVEPDEEQADEQLDDFNEYAEADAIRSELAYRLRTGLFGLGVTVAMTLALVLLTVLYAYDQLWMLTPSVMLALHAALLTAMLCINHRMVASGLKSLFALRADADTPPAVCGIVGLMYTATQFAWLDAIELGDGYFLSAAAGVCLLAGAIGRLSQIVRIRRNFNFVGNEKQKKNAATLLDDSKVAQAFGYSADENGLPRLVYYRRVSFLTRFLDCSYAADPADRVMRWFAPIVLGVSLLCAIGLSIVSKGQWEQAVMLFASSVMLAMPVWSMFAVQRAITRSCKRALRKGAMISGFAAAEQFGDHPKTVILEAAELFPKDQVKLHGIKTFSGTRIDEAITDSAAVMIAAKGPLCPIFHRLIENRTDILREVDSLAYEQDMGLSGWVGGRRVLIGNRRLLENHGVDVPPKEYELRYLRDGRNIVYLSTGGELSAMFVVSYLASDNIKAMLHALEREHVRITVRTCDPNITEALVCEVMDLPVRSVEVLSASEGRVYEALLTETKEERVPALIACGGHAVSKMIAIVHSCRMRRGAWAALISQLALSVAVMLACLFFGATTGWLLPSELLPAFLVVGGALAWLCGRLFRS